MSRSKWHILSFHVCDTSSVFTGEWNKDHSFPRGSFTRKIKHHSCPWLLLPPIVMQMPEVWSATWDHFVVLEPYCHWINTDVGVLRWHRSHGDLQDQVAAKGHVWIYGIAAAGICNNVCGPCYHSGGGLGLGGSIRNMHNKMWGSDWARPTFSWPWESCPCSSLDPAQEGRPSSNGKADSTPSLNGVGTTLTARSDQIKYDLGPHPQTWFGSH